MDSIFCCASIKPYRPQTLSHKPKFVQFMEGTKSTTDLLTPTSSVDLVEMAPKFVVEVSESDLVQVNFQKLNSYKNYRCNGHIKFFELNLYQKDPVNRHHRRANLARPASEIDP